MNTAHWHLLLNHLPIVGTVIGTLILISGYALKNNATVKRTALGVFIFSALAAIPAFLTGEGAEEIAERLPGVAESVIESHEDTGKIFLILVEVLGTLSIITLIGEKLKNRVVPILYGVALVASIGACVMAKQVATSGGEVRHTEIRGNVNGQPAAAPVQEGGGESDDD